MTVRFEQVLVQCRIERTVLETWIAREWVLPAREDESFVFSDADVARVEMICDLMREMELGEDAVEVVLPLIDQVYGLRASLRRIAEAIGALPEPARAQLRAELRKIPRPDRR
jgi:chaperone modulatory protein CbpM